MKRDPLIFWRSASPDVEKGAFGYLSECWGNDVLCIYETSPSVEREKCGWDGHSYDQVKCMQIPDNIDLRQFVQGVMTQYPHAIHIIGGFRRGMYKIMECIHHLDPNVKFICISERVKFDHKAIANFSKKLFYYLLSIRMNKRFQIFLPLGEMGVSCFRKLGYASDILYPFMYNPKIQVKVPIADKIVISKPLKFLYVGRFEYKGKGCNYLMEAFNRISDKSNWQLTLIGGYGSQTEDVIAWANQHDNISYEGSWSQTDMVNNMSAYDVVFIPSSGDGWNLSANYSIFAHIGCIVSDEAVSNELIEHAGSGYVYHYNNTKELQTCIENVIASPSIILEWKNRTVSYESRISSEVVGQYLIDIIDYEYYHIGQKPNCPWMI